MENQFRLKHIQATGLNLEVTATKQDATRNTKVTFDYSGTLNADDKTLWAILFTLSVADEEKYFMPRLHITAHFESDYPVDEAFLVSNFVRINAPAMAYPYIRTFVSNLTLNAGYEPIILPTINFVQYGQDKAAQTATSNGSKL